MKKIGKTTPNTGRSLTMITKTRGSLTILQEDMEILSLLAPFLSTTSP
jgi:hypothetical protein